jgi:hypothetical protein
LTLLGASGKVYSDEVLQVKEFDALKVKEEIQGKVQGELAGLSSEERIRRIRRMAEEGTLGDWWKQAKSGRRQRRCD